jgi:hypothetical protein
MANGSAPHTVRFAVLDLVRHPVKHLVYGWNWKSAVTSSGVRSLLFFFANIAAGPAAALRALLTELALRGVTAGVYGSITQGFRRAEPRWAGMLVVLIVVPALTHSLEYLVHSLRGTPHLGLSILISVCFTVVSTAFNLFAMREGLLIVGKGSRSLGEDLKAMPRLILAFLATAVTLPLARLKDWVEGDQDDDRDAGGAAPHGSEGSEAPAPI